MATILSLRLLLDNDKLMGPNFDSWYRKLKIILEHEWIPYVVTDPAPEEPAPNIRDDPRHLSEVAQRSHHHSVHYAGGNE